MQSNRLPPMTLFSAVLWLAASILAVQAADANNPEKSCRTFVQSFYKWYLTQPDSDRAYKRRASAFSPELLKQLNDDYAASQKVSGEIVGLDFDPFLDTNAEPFAKYVATKVTRKGTNYLVQVDGSGGNRTDHSRILSEVAFQNGKCKFVNFHYPGSKEPNENLVSILKTLKNDRKKAGIK
ncbi:MAG: YbjP/YqhG family protein [Candidatus Obscuribacterales bacterium]|nr:YbjP/YqhG family protein [Candidatus Obscuribacterales bacterium]